MGETRLDLSSPKSHATEEMRQNQPNGFGWVR